MVMDAALLLILAVIAGCLISGKSLNINVKFDKDAKIEEVRPAPVQIPEPDEKEEEKKNEEQKKQTVYNPMELLNTYLDEGVLPDGK